MQRLFQFSLLPLSMLSTAQAQTCAFPAGPTALGAMSTSPLVSLTQSRAASLAESDNFGTSVTTLGDINNDGISDFAVGIPGHDVAGVVVGAVAIYLGVAVDHTTGTPTLGAPDALIVGSGPGRFGTRVVAGQFRGNQKFDLAVSSNTGIVSVFDGASLLSTAPMLSTISVSGHASLELARVVDSDGDTFDELAIGQPLVNAGGGFRSGAVHLVRGSSPGAFVIDQTLVGSGAFHRFGSALVGQDIDGDGHGDLVIGAPGADAGRGAVGVAFGSVTAPFAIDRVLLEPATWPSTVPKMRLGSGLAVADVDGDGSPDLVVGGQGPTGNAGTAVIEQGPIVRTPGVVVGPLVEDWNLSGVAGENMGSRLVAADFDGDGRADVGMAGTRVGFGMVALFNMTGSAGSSNAASRMPPTTLVTLATASGSGQTGFGLAFVGDVDGNGLADLAIGSPTFDTPGTGSSVLANAGTVDILGGGRGIEFVDMDGDSFGSVSTAYCLRGAVVSSPIGGDCDDTVSTVFPGADEWCNGVDDDCDGTVDVMAVDGVVYVIDADGDGSGAIGSETAKTCVPPINGIVDLGEDCDDTDSAVFPGANERCNSVDDDCDGQVDEGEAIDGTVFYPDSDDDGFGDTALPSATLCSAPADFVSVLGDCDDADGTINPLADELCDAIDNDCDTLVDEGATDAMVFYGDADGDGYGDPNVVSLPACSAPAFFVDDNTDCDDGNDETNVDADEYCNGEDNNCNGVVDDFALDALFGYADTDGDGLGDLELLDFYCDDDGSIYADCNDDDAAEFVGPISVSPPMNPASFFGDAPITRDGGASLDHFGVATVFLGDFINPTQSLSKSDFAVSELAANSTSTIVSSTGLQRPTVQNAGRVLVFASETLASNSGPALTIVGEGSNDRFGHSLGRVDDLDGDGQDELIVGAPHYSRPGDTDLSGRVYLFCSDSTPDVSSAPAVISASQANAIITGVSLDHFGWSVAGVGDVGMGANGYDGVSDIAIGAPGTNASGTEGRAFVVSGDNLCSVGTAFDVLPVGDGPNATPAVGVALITNSSKGHMGWQVSGGGQYECASSTCADVPQAQLLIGAPNNRQGTLGSFTNALGAVYVVTSVLNGERRYNLDDSSTTSLTTPHAFADSRRLVQGTTPAQQQLGRTVHGGRQGDCAAMAFADRLGHVYLTPTVHGLNVAVDGPCLAPGNDVSMGSPRTIRIDLPNWSGTTHPTVRVIGDLDGDGLEEFLIAGAGASATPGFSASSQAPFIVRGAIGLYATSVGATSFTFADLSPNPSAVFESMIMPITPPACSGCTGNAFGYAVAASPDVTGDGLLDLLLTDPAFTSASGTESGRAYLVSTVPGMCVP